MIVDLHTRIWDSIDQLGASVAQTFRRRRTEPWLSTTASTEIHHAAMEPVSHAVVLGFESGLLEASISPEEVAASVAHAPAKRIGFAGIDPTQSRAVKRLESALEMGMAGVTMSPAAAGFHPSDTRALEVLEACQDKGLPVLIESGATISADAMVEFAQPYLLDEVARMFPQLKLVIGSFGLPWIDQGVALLAKHPNVYADVSGLVVKSWQLYNAMVNAYQANVMGQVLFASGFPFGEPEKAIVTLYSVNTISQGTPLPSVPREQLRTVVERDTFAALGIRKPARDAKPALPAEGGPAAASPSGEFEHVTVSKPSEKDAKS